MTARRATRRLVAQQVAAQQPARWPIRRIIAIDPGEIHNGLARWRFEREAGGGPWRPELLGSQELSPDGLIDTVESEIGAVDALVVEEFRLYPWMAREQGYSGFPTVERIGVLRYLARQAGVAFVLQGASVKKMAVQNAQGYGFPLRKLQGGRMDFPGRNQHCRDAEAHGFWFFYHDELSPLKLEDP